MAGVATDKGCECTLRARLNNVWPASKDLTLKLFCNDRTPAEGDIASAYTEATGGGYAAKTLTCGNWTVTDGAAQAQATYAMQQFTFSGALTSNPTIYGYYIVDADNVLQCAERFEVSVTPVADGNYVRVTPVYTLSPSV